MNNTQKSFKNPNYSFGNFYIVATPIGNLSDISLRAKEILTTVDLILCENKQNTINLLNHYDINNKLMKYHKFNETEKSDEIIKLILNDKKNIALVSDAGFPLVSDPGYIIVKKLIEKNISVIPIPGATAFLSALCSSNLETTDFYFYGFLKNKSTTKRQNELKKIFNFQTTIILYESPKRILSSLKDIKIIFGDIKICVAKEITKIHETFYRGNISFVINELQNSKLAGEYVIVLENNNILQKKIVDNNKIIIELNDLKNKYPSLSNRDIINIISYKLDLKKTYVYEIFNKKEINNED